MKIYKCDRCGPAFEKKDIHYGYEVVQKLHNGNQDTINEVDLCPNCLKNIYEFMEEKIDFSSSDKIELPYVDTIETKYMNLYKVFFRGTLGQINEKLFNTKEAAIDFAKAARKF